MNVRGALRAVSMAKSRRTISVVATPASSTIRFAPALDQQADRGDTDHGEDRQGDRTPHRHDRREVEEHGHGEHDPTKIANHLDPRIRTRPPKAGGNWPASARLAVMFPAANRLAFTEDAGGDGHHREPGLPQPRLRPRPANAVSPAAITSSTDSVP